MWRLDEEVERRLGRAMVYIISFGKKAADAERVSEALSAPVAESASDDKEWRDRSTCPELHDVIEP